jgi:hypothetical protein
MVDSFEVMDIPSLQHAACGEGAKSGEGVVLCNLPLVLTVDDVPDHSTRLPSMASNP